MGIQKGCCSSLICVIFWAQMGVFRATSHMHYTLSGDQKCVFIIHVGRHAIGPLHGHPKHPNNPKTANFWRSHGF